AASARFAAPALPRPARCPSRVADACLLQPIYVDEKEEVNERVTVELDPDNYDRGMWPAPGPCVHGCRPVDARAAGRIVPLGTPESRDGLYWGYTVRLAGSMAKIFKETIFAASGWRVQRTARRHGVAGLTRRIAQDGYDLLIGTSERGDSIDEM